MCKFDEIILLLLFFYSGPGWELWSLLVALGQNLATRAQLRAIFLKKVCKLHLLAFGT